MVSKPCVPASRVIICSVGIFIIDDHGSLDVVRSSVGVELLDSVEVITGRPITSKVIVKIPVPATQIVINQILILKYCVPWKLILGCLRSVNRGHEQIPNVVIHGIKIIKIFALSVFKSLLKRHFCLTRVIVKSHVIIFHFSFVAVDAEN